MRSPLLPLLPALALAACAQADGDYPSLLPRAIEEQSVAEPERPVAVATPDAALDARIAETLAGLDEAERGFVAAAQAAEAQIAVARGLPEGSEPWLDAQKALGVLGSRRSPVLSLLAELEEMAIARGKQGLPPYPALDAAVARVSALSAAQAARAAGLEAAFANPQ